MHKLYSIVDTKAKVWGVPQSYPSEVHAIRQLQAVVNYNGADNVLHTHSEDFDLYELAEFDHDTGALTPHKEPRFLTNAAKLKQKEETNAP